MKVPETNNAWANKVRLATGDERLMLIAERPIVAWFSEKKFAVHRLIKISARLGEDLWIIQGRGNKENKDFLMTPKPYPLDTCLNWPDRELGWILCEFPDELSFYKAVLQYSSDQ